MRSRAQTSPLLVATLSEARRVHGPALRGRFWIAPRVSVGLRDRKVIRAAPAAQERKPTPRGSQNRAADAARSFLFFVNPTLTRGAIQNDAAARRPECGNPSPSITPALQRGFLKPHIQVIVATLSDARRIHGPAQRGRFWIAPRVSVGLRDRKVIHAAAAAPSDASCVSATRPVLRSGPRRPSVGRAGFPDTPVGDSHMSGFPSDSLREPRERSTP